VQPGGAAHLPAPLTSFIGRERETADVARMLGTTRLLTLTGAGGCGKTRLALEVARRPVAEYADGVWLVELAPLADPALVPRAIADAVGAPEPVGRPPLDALVDHLRDKAGLLVLDNCEHLVEACALAAERLLRACPALRLLATSREALRVGGETTWRVPSLSLPAEACPTVEAVARSEAGRLFAERAAAAVVGFALTEENAAAVGQICQRLDGIPLAIELAAARMPVLSVEEIAARLDEAFGPRSGRFRLLTGGSRTALPRQQTLRATVDWSHELLSEPERTLLRRLSVFAGGWTLEAAEAVAGVGDPFELLARLVAKSLVLAEGQAGATRYRFLETIRQYGRERLRDAGEESLFRDRHRDWCVALVEDAAPGLRGPNPGAWIGRLEREHENLRAALSWSSQRGDASTVARLAGTLWWFWFPRGHVAEGRRWLEAALASTDLSPQARAAVLHGAGVLARAHAEYELAAALLEESLALRRWSEDKPGIAAVLFDLAPIAEYWGDYGRSARLFEESLALRRELADAFGTAQALIRFARAAIRQDDHERAAALLDESWALCRRLGSDHGMAMTLRLQGGLAFERADYGRAADLLGQSVVMLRDEGNRRMILELFSTLILAALRAGDQRRAAGLLREGLVLCRDLGVRRDTAECLEAAAELAAVRRQWARTARLLGAAEAARDAIGLVMPPSQRAAHDRVSAAARRGLDVASFAASWAEGRAMSLNEAVDYALADTDPPPGTTAEDKSSPTGADALTRREREVVALIGRRLTNHQIAERLVLSERTVHAHVRNILGKLEFDSRAQVAVWAAERGLVQE
jgi:predicted ATPase/DNA-binding CsgD family transcriptional regulator